MRWLGESGPAGQGARGGGKAPRPAAMLGRGIAAAERLPFVPATRAWGGLSGILYVKSGHRTCTSTLLVLARRQQGLRRASEQCYCPSLFTCVIYCAFCWASISCRRSICTTGRINVIKMTTTTSTFAHTWTPFTPSLCMDTHHLSCMERQRYRQHIDPHGGTMHHAKTCVLHPCRSHIHYLTCRRHRGFADGFQSPGWGDLQV